MMSNAAIKPITTEQEYEVALSRIEVLMDAEEGTPEAEEIDVLATQVELYEEEHYPIDFPDPISAIEFRIEQSGLSPKDLIPLIGSKAKVSEVLSGKRALTLSMIRALHQHLHIRAEVLLGKPGATLPEIDVNIDWSKFPLSAMAKLGWIEMNKNLKDYAEEIMRNLIQRAGDFNNFSPALYRKNDGTRQNAKTDPYALKAWCYQLLATANEATLPAEYQDGSITKEFAQTLVKLSCSQNGPKLAKEYLAKHGIHLIPLPHLPHTHLDGALLSLADGTPVIGLTLRYDRLDNFWFSLCHEIAHIALHLKKDSHNSFIDDLSVEPVDNIEVEANEWAKEVLIPSKLWNDSSLGPKPSSASLKTNALQLGIHPAIVAGRIRKERNNYSLLARHVGEGKVRKCFW